MPSIQEEILQSFLERLVESDGFDIAKVDALRTLFESEKKPKAAEVVEALKEDSTEAIP